MTDFFLPLHFRAGIDQPSAYALDQAARRETDELIRRYIAKYDEGLAIPGSSPAKARLCVLLDLDIQIHNLLQAREAVSAHITQHEDAIAETNPTHSSVEATATYVAKATQEPPQ